jgi:hypothetical protein
MQSGVICLLCAFNYLHMWNKFFYVDSVKILNVTNKEKILVYLLGPAFM